MWQFLVMAHCLLLQRPSPVSLHRQEGPDTRQRKAQYDPYWRGRDLRGELVDGNCPRQNSHRSPNPGQERSLIGKRESVVRHLAFSSPARFAGKSLLHGVSLHGLEIIRVCNARSLFFTQRLDLIVGAFCAERGIQGVLRGVCVELSSKLGWRPQQLHSLYWPQTRRRRHDGQP